MRISYPENAYYAQSLLYGCPAGAIAGIAILVSGILGARLSQRILVSSMGLWIAILGMVLIVALPFSNKGGRLAGFYISNTSTAAFVSVLSLISSNVAGYTKKTTVAAFSLLRIVRATLSDRRLSRPKRLPGIEGLQMHC